MVGTEMLTACMQNNFGKLMPHLYMFTLLFKLVSFIVILHHSPKKVGKNNVW